VGPSARLSEAGDVAGAEPLLLSIPASTAAPAGPLAPWESRIDRLAR
jgi:hypothetical protein